MDFDLIGTTEDTEPAGELHITSHCTHDSTVKKTNELSRYISQEDHDNFLKLASKIQKLGWETPKNQPDQRSERE